jgi:type IV pilus assembly protein PilY1
MTFRQIAAMLCMTLSFTTVATSAHAEDIDLYTGGVVDGGRPNVIFILDNSANWSASNGAANCTYDDGGAAPSSQGKKMGIEQCALNNAIYALQPAVVNGVEQPSKYNIGFMFFNEGSNTGGYPRKALIELNRTNAAALLTMIKGLGINTDKTNNPSFAQTMHEAYLYFKGAAPYQGKAGTKYDATAFSGTRYALPISNPCQKNFLIIITNGSPDYNTAGTDTTLLAGDGGITTAITYPTSFVSANDQKSVADEYARFLYGTDLSTSASSQNIVTHTIAVTGAASDGNYPNFWAGVSRAGGGKAYTASDAATIKAKILDLFNEIQSVNSVFTSSSLPVSVNTQGTYLNQIFMGVFRPDINDTPRWMGNLKQYQFCLDSLQKLYLGDANCLDAVSSTTGFLTPLASSFWSTTSSYWNFGTYMAGSPSDAPDGNIVEKGGAAQKQRGLTPATRTLYTCPTSGCAAGLLSTSPFNTTTISTSSTTNQANFGVSTSAALSNLINWVRGQDLLDENGDGSTSDMRASIHGDVLHSRPVVVNYGGTTGIVAFYGANDGIFRAVNASQTGTTAGQELWGFVAPEFYGKYLRLYNNSPVLKFPNTVAGISPTPQPKDYFFDGPVGVYQQLDSAGATTRVILYIGMRRGGRFIYALDVTTPTAPRFLWKKGCTSTTSGTTTCDSGFSSIGQTWSTPKVAKVRGNANPVVIFGGGYDNAAEDAEPAGTTTMGNSVYVLDALLGTVVKTFTSAAMTKSIPSDITLIDRDFDGNYDRAYATDMGGNVWRMDIDDTLPANWTINKLASLSTASNSRKFFFPADVVPTRNFDAVLIGSGDREHPLSTSAANSVLNRFYMIKDLDTGKTPSATYVTVNDNDVDSLSDLFNATSSAYDQTKRGWFVNLGTGEKVVNAPTTIAGFVHFGTNKPKANDVGQCTNLGVAQGYTVDFLQGKPNRPVNFVGGGLPPSPVAGLVSINTNGTTKKVPFIIGGGDDGSGTLQNASAIAGSDVKIAVPVSRRRTYWHKKID